ITHRDVKPGNVLMAHDGRIKLTDFGIARNPADQTLTATGLMLGSPAYIAPEIASGGPINPASDLWGLGATLFAAVEGRPPYDAGTAMATVAAVVHDEVPTASCPGPLAEVISGLMIKDPTRRMPLSQVRQLLGAPPESADHRSAVHAVVATGSLSPTDAPLTTPRRVAGNSPAAPAKPRRRTGQLATDPGPLPFAVASGVDPHTARGHPTARRVKATGAGRRALLWILAVVAFFGAAITGFGAVRVAGGRPAVPDLGAHAAVGPSADDVVLTPRALQIAEPDGIPPARFTITVPQDWPEFLEQRPLGSNPDSVLRFVSTDGSEVIAVERLTGALTGVGVDQYLTAYLRRLAQAVPELVETQRQSLSGGALDATFRTQEGGELRRTTYLRLLPVKADLWMVSVTVPTEREGAGRMKLFEPVVAEFAPGP
ncbi:MAG: protein kinase domain-containing protein, partial [Pseudonocardiaceae bacterium]